MPVSVPELKLAPASSQRPVRISLQPRIDPSTLEANAAAAGAGLFAAVNWYRLAAGITGHKFGPRASKNLTASANLCKNLTASANLTEVDSPKASKRSTPFSWPFMYKNATAGKNGKNGVGGVSGVGGVERRLGGGGGARRCF